MAKKQYFMPITIKLEIKDKEIFPYHFELKNVKGWIEDTPGQSTLVQARGSLSVVTEQSDYNVFIKGYEKIPPFELKDMPSGQYELRIIRNGIEKILTVTVGDNERKFIDLDTL